jgi:hypothetical protein
VCVCAGGRAFLIAGLGVELHEHTTHTLPTICTHSVMPRRNQCQSAASIDIAIRWGINPSPHTPKDNQTPQGRLTTKLWIVHEFTNGKTLQVRLRLLDCTLAAWVVELFDCVSPAFQHRCIGSSQALCHTYTYFACLRNHAEVIDVHLRRGIRTHDDVLADGGHAASTITRSTQKLGEAPDAECLRGRNHARRVRDRNMVMSSPRERQCRYETDNGIAEAEAGLSRR